MCRYVEDCRGFEWLYLVLSSIDLQIPCVCLLMNHHLRDPPLSGSVVRTVPIGSGYVIDLLFTVLLCCHIMAIYYIYIYIYVYLYIFGNKCYVYSIYLLFIFALLIL